MKIRDSGMPAEEYWETLFDVPLILDRLRIDESLNDVVELGCGYGTFTVPIARIIRGTLTTFDVDQEMIERTRQRAGDLPIIFRERDIMESGFGIQADAALLFNILHCDSPVKLLRHAAATAPKVLVIHWRYGETPRGPNLDIRPRPEQITSWAAEAGLTAGPVIDLPPWHYGLVLSSSDAS
jgi:SAM-dependent methyltransferase